MLAITQMPPTLIHPYIRVMDGFEEHGLNKRPIVNHLDYVDYE